ncbi:hypothetical protein V2H45_22205 [Tumidithrix elongata RA019]|uniref:Transposase n=1 Tax=Tumidithrix elongata BACA0141 TaxID=2716417 RepID=A0AAW9Q912_9CYAN|nr:hypothetical protein [Tumidithrix elongata RA019]
MREFFSEVYGTLPPEEWKITRILLAPDAPDAPDAPEQNAVENIWLQAKRFIRKLSRLCKKFKSVKLLFELISNFQAFLFLKAFL